MGLLALLRPKPQPKEEKKEDQAKTKKMKRAVSAAGAAFLALGVTGLAVFGYLIFTSGGFSALTGMATGIGLIVSLVVLLTGIYMK